jgi:hypothetical protein
MISAEQLVGEELAEWYSLTPLERWRESAKLWEVYLSLGGSLDPEPDTQSLFFDPNAPSSPSVDVLPEAMRLWRKARKFTPKGKKV